MKEILSTKISLNKTLSMHDILSLHQFAKNYNGIIFMLVGKKVIKLNELPKLVSFLLTYEKNGEITLVVEGQNVKETLSELQKRFKPLQLNLINALKKNMTKSPCKIST